jgi:hypothetical protein
MSEKRSIGLNAILIGAIAVDGGMAADGDLASVGVTFQDSCTLAQETPETNPIYSEENADAEEIIIGTTKKTLEFEIINTSAAACKAAFGGEITGEGDAEVWEGPRDSVIIEKSVRIKTKTGENIDIPRVKFANTMQWKFSKKDVNRIKFVGTILVPLKAGVAPIKKYKTPAGV